MLDRQMDPVDDRKQCWQCAQMRPFLFSVRTMQGNEGIRSVAIHHFGELLKDMSQYTWMLNPMVLGNLVPLILFLEDKEIRVSKVRLFLFFLILQKITMFYANTKEEIFRELFLSHRHVDTH